MNLIVSIVDFAGDGLEWPGDCHGSIFFRMHHCSVCSNLYGDSSEWFWTVYVMFLQECVPRSCVGWDGILFHPSPSAVGSIRWSVVSYPTALPTNIALLAGLHRSSHYPFSWLQKRSNGIGRVIWETNIERGLRNVKGDLFLARNIVLVVIKMSHFNFVIVFVLLKRSSRVHFISFHSIPFDSIVTTFNKSKTFLIFSYSFFDWIIDSFFTFFDSLKIN